MFPRYPLPSPPPSSASSAEPEVMLEEFYSSPASAFLAESAKVREAIERGARDSGDHRSSLTLFYNWFTGEFGRRFGNSLDPPINLVKPSGNLGLESSNSSLMPLGVENQQTLPDFSSTFLNCQPSTSFSAPSGFGQLQELPGDEGMTAKGLNSQEESPLTSAFSGLSVVEGENSGLQTGDDGRPSFIVEIETEGDDELSTATGLLLATQHYHTSFTSSTNNPESLSENPLGSYVFEKVQEFQKQKLSPVDTFPNFSGLKETSPNSQKLPENTSFSSSTRFFTFLRKGPFQSALTPPAPNGIVFPFPRSLPPPPPLNSSSNSFANSSTVFNPLNSWNVLNSPSNLTNSTLNPFQRWNSLVNASNVSLTPFKPSTTFGHFTPSMNASSNLVTTLTPPLYPSSPFNPFTPGPSTLTTPPGLPTCCNSIYLTMTSLRRHARNCHKSYPPGAFAPHHYRCLWPGCNMQSNYRQSVAQHVRREHLKVPVTIKGQRAAGLLEARRAYDFVASIEGGR